MNTTNSKTLSPYLKRLVDQRAVPAGVAWIFNQLPDWKQQQEAVEDWQDRLEDPAREIVAEFATAKLPHLRCTLDAFIDGDEIRIPWGYHFLWESLDDYVHATKSALERVLKENTCPNCKAPLTGDQAHANCYTLLREMAYCDSYREKIAAGKDVIKNEHWLRMEDRVVKEFSQAYRTGVFSNGTPWATPYSDLNALREAGEVKIEAVP